MPTETESPTLLAEQLAAMFLLDAPVPVRVLYELYGSRATFRRWSKAGLVVRPVPGMGPTVIPSEFREFLLKQRGDAKPSAQ